MKDKLVLLVLLVVSMGVNVFMACRIQRIRALDNETITIYQNRVRELERSQKR